MEADIHPEKRVSNESTFFEFLLQKLADTGFSECLAFRAYQAAVDKELGSAMNPYFPQLLFELQDLIPESTVSQSRLESRQTQTDLCGDVTDLFGR